MAITPVAASHAVSKPHAVAPAVIAKNAFKKLYDANQGDHRPGWPTRGHAMKLTGGATLEDLGGVNKLPKGSPAAKAVNRVIREGIDGDQDAYQVKAGGKTFIAVGVFAEDAARDQIWLWDAKGEHRVAYGEPNEETGKLHWK